MSSKRFGISEFQQIKGINYLGTEIKTKYNLDNFYIRVKRLKKERTERMWFIIGFISFVMFLISLYKIITFFSGK